MIALSRTGMQTKNSNAARKQQLQDLPQTDQWTLVAQPSPRSWPRVESEPQQRICFGSSMHPKWQHRCRWSWCRNWQDGSSNRLYHHSSVRPVPALAPTSEGGLGAKRLPAEEHPSLSEMWACTLKPEGRWRRLLTNNESS